MLAEQTDFEGLAQRHRATLASLDARGDAMVQRAVRWSEIASGSTDAEGLERMRHALGEAAAAAIPGVRIETVPLAPTTLVDRTGNVTERLHGPALRLSVRPEAPVRIAMSGHFDTVFPPGSGFDRCTPLPDGSINGPGLADMKGGLSILFGALEAFERHELRHGVGWELLLSPDEEIGSPASAALLHALGARSHVGMTYEPALPDGAMAGPRKGSGNWALILRGRAAHVGRAAHEGRNAVVGAARIAAALTDAARDMAGVILNVGAIDGGGPTNVVPDLAILRFNARVDDAAQARAVETVVADTVQAVCAAAELTHALHGGFARPPKPETPGLRAYLDAVVAAGASVGAPTSWRATGGVCDGNNLSAAGCPTVDSLGVRGGLIHSRDEFAIPESFAERGRLSLLLMLAFADGSLDARALRTAHVRALEGVPA